MLRALLHLSYELLFFFFQAEDGIRDDLVTGVQTCALPICHPLLSGDLPALTGHQAYPSASQACGSGRSQTWRGTGTIVPGGSPVCGPLRSKTSSYDPYGDRKSVV